LVASSHTHQLSPLLVKLLTTPGFLTWVLFDPTRKDFFDPKGKKIENFGILRGIFPMPNPN